MRLNWIIKGCALLLCGTALAGHARAQSVGGTVYAFGDSLTDNGNIPHYLGGFDYPAPPYYKNHFSNGPVFVEYLPGLIGSHFVAGDDFGVGGAFAGDGNIAGIPQLPGTAQEIAAVTAAGLRFGASDTVILWAGSNNYFSIIGGLPAGTTIADPTVQSDIKQVAGAITTDAANLIGLGARRLVVFNVPDLGSTPSQTMAGVSTISTQISQENNALLQPELAALRQRTGANIYLINAALGIEEVLADPARYGITNTTSECILTPACVNGTRAVQDTYLFWDDVHPTTGIHDYLARIVANQIEAGSTIGGQAELMLIQAQDFSNSLAQHLDGQRTTPPQAGSLNVWLQGHYGSGSRDTGGASDGFSYQDGSVVGGADIRLAPGLIVGAAAGYGQPTANFGGGEGKVGFNAYEGGVYASLFNRWAYVDLSGAYSRFDGQQGSRPGVLAGDTIHFSPQGHAWAAGASTGLTLHAGNLVYGPVAGVAYTNAVVDPYTESGEPLVIQSVAQQNVDSLVGRAGLQATVEGTVGGFSIRPHWMLAAEREFLDTRREVETSFLSAGLPITDPLRGFTGTYGRLGVGAAADLGRALTATVDFQATFGRGNGEDQSTVLKLNMAF
jgi:outer membrane lipase/esterase